LGENVACVALRFQHVRQRRLPFAVRRQRHRRHAIGARDEHAVAVRLREKDVSLATGARDARRTLGARERELVDETTSSLIPIWAIGRPVAELEAALALPHGDDPKALVWRDQSLGDPHRDVEITAHVRRGRVVGISVVPPFGDPVADILWQRLVTLYGEPDRVSSHEELVDVRWRRRPGIRVARYWEPIAPHMFIADEHGVRFADSRPEKPDAHSGALISIGFGNVER